MSRKLGLLLNKLASLEASSPEFVELSKQVVSVHKEAIKQKEEKELAKALEPPKPKVKKVVLCDKCKSEVEPEVKEEHKHEAFVEPVVEAKPKKVKKSSK